MTAFHSISYEGSVTTALRLHYHSLPIVIEELFVNESIDIKHSRGQFQRTFVIDAYTEKLSVSYNVRKFFGATDYCGYGGIRMFNQILYKSRTVNNQNFEAHVQNGNLKDKLRQQFIKNTSYNPICSNDSLIFQSTFYLDFGKTYFVFYDFSPMWNIDVTLSVHPSKYIALYDVEQTYCSHKMPAYIYSDFFINCNAMLVKLTRQVPFILQWSRESRSLGEKKKISFQCFWPDIMDLKINQNYRNLKVYNSRNELCTPNQIIRIARVSNITTVLIGTTTQSQIVPNAESFAVYSSLSNCLAMDQTSYVVIMNPSPGNARCVLSETDFTVRGFSEKSTNYKIASKDCLSLDATMTNKGVYVLYLVQQSFNIRLQDNSIYYSVTINKDCISSAKMITYFTSVYSTSKRHVHFEFPLLGYHHIFYDFSNLRFLQFYLERFSLDCAVYIEFTSSARKKSFLDYRKRYYKVRYIFKMSR